MNHIEHRGRKPSIEDVKEKVNRLVVAGYSFQEIADALGLGSRQAARYHFTTYRAKLAKEKKVEAKPTNGQK